MCSFAISKQNKNVRYHPITAMQNSTHAHDTDTMADAAFALTNMIEYIIYLSIAIDFA